jgi:membrane protein DedA with SNARE-associated domain
MGEVLDFVVRHGEAFIFLYVLADQLGVPVPAVPALLAMGALAGMGKLDFTLALLLSVVASLAADLVWYALGRTRGGGVLRLVCAIALEPDSCVRRTEDVFVRHGVRALILAKFVPGLSTVAPPLAGLVGVPLPRFAAYSSLAALLWAGAWGGLGYLAGDALEHVAIRSGRFGTALGVLVATALTVWLVVKWLKRRWFLRSLRIARISPEALSAALDTASPPLVVDLRSALDLEHTPYVIPGALRILPDELERRYAEIPRDRDVVVYCS